MVATQLKYSTRQPSRRWTASRLCASDTNKSASIIKRLADVFKGYLAGPARVDVLAKLTIRLVSNQPLDDKLRVALESAQSILQIHGVNQLPTRDLLMKLPAGPKKIIAGLQSKAGLRSVEFADFLRVLDLSGCGEEARSFQRLRLIQELAPSVSASPVAALRNLRDLIEREARPEGSTSRGLIEADIVAALEVSHKDDLFPARSHLKLPENFIKTSDAQKLATTVVNATDQRVLAHGDAGVGKTTTVQSLITYLPAGSVVIIYDCYGGGNYLVMGEQRHTNNRAFMQLTNELALQCGTPFLIKPAREKYDLQRNFRRALDAADNIVSAQGGILVIVVDAADNAVIAAAVAREDDCFVPALWTTPLPERSRLLMTSRSHRRFSLNPPSDVIEYELRGFDAHASAQHLRLVFPDADAKSCKVFDERTSGNPRVQYYLLDRARSENKDKRSLDALLKTSKRTPNDLFADLLDAAVKHAAKPEDAKHLLAILLSLSRPVPLQVFADACAIKFKDGLNFCRALVPGLIIKNEFVSFRDEDFETYLRSHVTETEAAVAHDRLATYFLPLSNADPYASRVVAEHLAQAGRHADVIALAVNGPEPLPIRDQMQRLQVTRRRLSLAMPAATLLGQGAEAVRLTLLAAEAARSDGAVTALVLKIQNSLRATAMPKTSPGYTRVQRITIGWARLIYALRRSTRATPRIESGRRSICVKQKHGSDAWLRRRWCGLPTVP